MDADGRVLVVDDEEVVLRALSRALRACGYDPVVARSLAEARGVLSVWREQPCGFALVDNKLEDGFGLDLLPELRALEPAPGVALLSAALTSEIAAEAFKRGALAMAHPADHVALTELLEVLLHLRERARTTKQASGTFPAAESRPATARPRFVFGPFVLDGHSLATPSGHRRLRPLESAILAHLAARSPAVVAVGELAKLVLGRADDGVLRSVYSQITNLRLNLGPYAALVTTERGRGYRLSVSFFEAA
jgi:DNA-binding response OmpR family regulator